MLSVPLEQAQTTAAVASSLFAAMHPATALVNVSVSVVQPVLAPRAMMRGR
jgi:hypothetical protein